LLSTQCNTDRSINLDGAINPPDKGIGCQEANGSGKQSIDSASKTRISEEKKRRNKSLYVQVIKVIVDAVEEDPESAAGSDGK